MASLCVGAFLLAATGLLNGKRCATHWISADEFRSMFPEAVLQLDSIITDEGGIYSSGGAQSYRNLILYLIEKYADREIAVHASKYFQIDINRDSQARFMIFKGQKDHQDDSVREAQEYIESNYSRKIAVDELCSRFAVGRRTLERRFIKGTGNTVIEYLRKVRIEGAKMSLESTGRSVAEVMYAVGYSDTRAFRNVFRRTTGMSPVDYRNKFNRGLDR